jgi:hypothetical protein
VCVCVCVCVRVRVRVRVFVQVSASNRFVLAALPHPPDPFSNAVRLAACSSPPFVQYIASVGSAWLSIRQFAAVCVRASRAVLLVSILVRPPPRRPPAVPCNVWPVPVASFISQCHCKPQCSPSCCQCPVHVSNANARGHGHGNRRSRPRRA